MTGWVGSPKWTPDNSANQWHQNVVTSMFNNRLRWQMFIAILCQKNYICIKMSVLTGHRRRQRPSVTAAAFQPTRRLSQLLQSTQPPVWQSLGQSLVRRRWPASSAMESTRPCPTRQVYEDAHHRSATQLSPVKTLSTIKLNYRVAHKEVDHFIPLPTTCIPHTLTENFYNISTVPKTLIKMFTLCCNNWGHSFAKLIAQSIISIRHKHVYLWHHAWCHKQYLT